METAQEQSTEEIENNLQSGTGTINEKDSEVLKMSKRQMKRAKNQEKWLETKAYKKKLKKQQQKEKKRLEQLNKNIEKPNTENNIDNQEEKKVENLEKEDTKDNEVLKPSKPYLTPKQLKEEYKKSMENSPQIIIDCSFQDLLTQKELKSLCSQIGYCHSVNKKQPLHCKMTLTSYKSKVKDKLSKLGADQWGILLLDQHYLHYYDPKKMVYLTGDAEEDIDELNPDKIYIIGGMVDRNRLKKATYDQAKKEGIEVKRFPISKYLKLSSSCILTVNHVFEILVRKFNNESWKQAFENTIPKRKIMEYIDLEANNNKEEDESDAQSKRKQEKDNKQQKNNFTSFCSIILAFFKQDFLKNIMKF